jgi:hypothetical protein
MEWIQPFPWPKMGWSGHPILAKGVALIFLLLLLFLKNKIKLMAKTTLFWVGWVL